MSGTVQALKLRILPVLLLAAGVLEARAEDVLPLQPARVDLRTETSASYDGPARFTAEPFSQERISGLAHVQDDCVGGVVKDDGSLETGYGWVPSVIDGVYVQEFHISEFPSHRLESMCICWLRTREDGDLSFDVVFYQDHDGTPAETPYASVPAVAFSVPEGVASGGAFYEVNVSQIIIPGGRFYIGARWNPSLDQFFFICADNSPETDPVNVFYIDDRAEGWGSALDTSDPVFDGHRAIMVRATAQLSAEFAIPALGTAGSAMFALVLATAGWLLLTRR